MTAGNSSTSSSEHRWRTLRFLACLLPALALVVACEILLGPTDTTYSRKRAMMEAKGSTLEVLCLGNSHGLYGLAPEFFGRPGYNLANLSQSLDLDGKLLQKYLGQMPRLRTVVIEISYFSLWYRMPDGAESWRNHLYTYYYDIAGDWLNPLDHLSLSDHSLLLAFGPETSLSLLMRKYLAPATESTVSFPGGELVTPDGSFRVPGSSVAANAKQATEVVARHRQSMRAERAEYNVAVLLEMARLLQARGGRLLLVTTPVQPAYRALMDQAIWDHTQSILHLMQKRTPNVEYLDFIDDARFGPEDFYDADHLSGRGAEKLSRILAKRL